MTRQTTLLLLLAIVFGAMPIMADSITLNESQIVWQENMPFVFGIPHSLHRGAT